MKRAMAMVMTMRLAGNEECDTMARVVRAMAMATRVARAMAMGMWVVGDCGPKIKCMMMLNTNMPICVRHNIDICAICILHV